MLGPKPDTQSECGYAQAMLDNSTKTIIKTAASAAGVPATVVQQMLALAEMRPAGERLKPALLSQAQKARQLGVSRFTIRKLVRLGKLHPIELLPGLVRYPADELTG
jgi:hypothetical protein